MKLRQVLIAGAALAVTAAVAQDSIPAPEDALDLTMVLLPEGAVRPDAVTRVIELPPAASNSATAAGNAARGLDTANAARGRGAAGLETAEEAREQGRERAQQGREDVGRGPPDWAGGPGGRGGPGGADLPADPPGNRPEHAGPPETPGPPGN